MITTSSIVEWFPYMVAKHIYTVYIHGEGVAAMCTQQSIIWLLSIPTCMCLMSILVQQHLSQSAWHDDALAIVSLP